MVQAQSVDTIAIIRMMYLLYATLLNMNSRFISGNNDEAYQKNRIPLRKCVEPFLKPRLRNFTRMSRGD